MSDNPSAGALRAAQAIAWEVGKALTSCDFRLIDDPVVAAIIDRETGLGELVEAAESALWSGALKFPNNVLDKTIKTKLEKALARVQGKD